MVADPVNYEEAKSKSEWQNAMTEEMNAIERNKTWEFTKLPLEKKLIGVKWIYRTKYKSNGSISKYKARLVTKDYVQEHSVDCKDMFCTSSKDGNYKSVVCFSCTTKLVNFSIGCENNIFKWRD